MSSLKDTLSQVFLRLDIRDPPLRGTDLLGDEILVGKLEEIALGVVAGIRVEHRKSGSSSIDLGEEIDAFSIAVVVGSRKSRDYGIAVVLEQLAIVAGVLSAILPEEEILLEGHVGGNADSEDTPVVAVVHHADALDGVVLEHEVPDIDIGVGIDTEERTHTIKDRVVDELEGAEIDGFAEIDAVAAVARDVVDLAGVEAELRNCRLGVVVAVGEQTADIGSDAAVDEADVADNRSRAGKLVDDAVE